MLPTTDPVIRARPAPASNWQPSPEVAARLEADYLALPPPTPDWACLRGPAGTRLRARRASRVPTDLLEVFARESLGAKRLNANYLDALRIVLGNQAHAERERYDLELNQRVPFATQRTMRTIIEQMQAAGQTTSRKVQLGGGKAQTIQCFAAGEPRTPLYWRNSYGTAEDAEELERLCRMREGACRCDAELPLGLRDEDVPRWGRSLTTQIEDSTDSEERQFLDHDHLEMQPA